MRRTRWLLLWLGMLAGCAGPSAPSAADMLVAGSNDAAPRLVIEGDRVVRVTIPTDFLALPQAVREAAEAVLEGGQLVFSGVEKGDRGGGYLVEKRYTEPVPHERAVRIDGAGRVLSRSRTLPVSQAPAEVLATALRYGSFVERVEVVFTPSGAPRWEVLVQDRDGRSFACTIRSSGELVRRRRRATGRVDS